MAAFKDRANQLHKWGEDLFLLFGWLKLETLNTAFDGCTQIVSLEALGQIFEVGFQEIGLAAFWKTLLYDKTQ